MLRAYMVVVQLPRLVVGQVQHLTGARIEGHVLRRPAFATDDAALDLGAHARGRHSQAVQHASSHAIALAHQSQKEVLGAHVVLA